MTVIIRKTALCIFCLWLASGLVGTVLGIDTQLFSAAEMRSPMLFPPLPRGSGFRAFFNNVESWLADRVYARQQYLSLHRSLGLQAYPSIQDTPSIIGRESWLFLGNSYNKVLDDTRNRRPIVNMDVERKIVQLKNMSVISHRHNVAFVMLVAPNKHTIYPEYLPEWLHVKSTYRLADAVRDKAELLDIPFVYPKREMLAFKEQETIKGRRIYYMDDTHWNAIGALTAFNLLWETLQRQTVLPPILQYVTVRPVRKETPGDLIAIGKHHVKYQDTESYAYEFAPEFFEQYKKTDTILFIRDSFGVALKPLLDSVFVNIIEIHHSKLGNSLESLIEQHKPQVIIYEIVERNFKY